MSFFKGMQTRLAGKNRDSLLKESLINNLSECVKDIQFSNQAGDKFHSILGSDDSTNSLCIALEAILIHGLKDTFFRKAKNAFTNDPDQKPEPNFWPLVLVLSHRQNIDQISSLPQITTEIGQCRAWTRTALNDCLLSSYLATLLRNIGAVKPFYSRWAFVCDSEILDVARRLIEGLESCIQFNLPINSSLLNSWPEQVLMLAGVWTPAMRLAPISAGLDIASTLSSEDVTPKHASQPEHGILSSLGSMLALNEEEALRFILSKDAENADNFPASITIKEAEKVKEDIPEIVDTPSTSKTDNVVEPPSSVVETNDDSNSVDSVAVSDYNVVGNSLVGKSGWSSECNDELINSVTSLSSHGSLVKTPESRSLTSLADNHSLLGGSYVQTPNIQELLKRLHKDLKLNEENIDIQNLPVEPATPDDPMLTGLGFEIVPKSVTDNFSVSDLKMLMKQLTTLSREYGLDSQNYQCKGCQDLLGTTVSKAKVCVFSGDYFCKKCIDPNVFMIPARVIHNWDFKRYCVSKTAAAFLLEFQHYPLIDMKKINPKIYYGVEDMMQLQGLRVQLNFLRAYIFNCREPVIEELQKRIWPREYLYEHIHQYSISDLAQIPNGSLALQLEKVVCFAKNHVKDCWLCSQKGFICEVCNHPKILYPFDIETTFRCDDCSSVFHSKCLNVNKPCPKCKRRELRRDISLVDAIHNNFV